MLVPEFVEGNRRSSAVAGIVEAATDIASWGWGSASDVAPFFASTTPVFPLIIFDSQAILTSSRGLLYESTLSIFKVQMQDHFVRPILSLVD